MANVNLAALDMFRTASGWEANGVANLDDGKEIRQNGTYGGALSALTRSKTEVAENNRVRTELLRALGHAFNLSGMQEEEGKVTFSKSFMDSLQKLLGAELKRDDFKVDGDGNVSSADMSLAPYCLPSVLSIPPAGNSVVTFRIPWRN